MQMQQPQPIKQQNQSQPFVTNSCPPDEKQQQQVQKTQTKKQFNTDAKQFDFNQLQSGTSTKTVSSQNNNQLNGGLQQNQPAQNAVQFDANSAFQQQQSLPKLKPKKKLQLPINAPTFNPDLKVDLQVQQVQPVQQAQQVQPKSAALQKLDLSTITKQKDEEQKKKENDEKKKKEDDEIKRKEEEQKKKQDEESKKLIEKAQKQIRHQKDRFFSGETFTLNPDNVDYKYVKIYYELNEKDFTRPESGDLSDDLQEFKAVELINNYWNRVCDKKDNKVQPNKYQKYSKQGGQVQYQGNKNKKQTGYGNQGNQNQYYGNNNPQQQQNFNVKGQQYDANQQKQAEQALTLGKKSSTQAVQGGFQRKQVNVEEQKIKESIKNTTGKWMENALKQNENEFNKKKKQIIFLLQTLSPDNIDKRVEELYEYNKEDNGENDEIRENLIEVIIEKGHKQWKYVKTFAELCQKIISKTQKQTKKNKTKFKSQLISQIQNLLSKEYEITEKVIGQEEAQQEKFFDKIRESKKLFVVFIGECIKVKVLSSQVNSHVISHFLSQFFHYYQLSKRQKVSSTEKLTSEQLKIKYHSNIMIETLLKFLDTNGEFIDKKNQESLQKNATPDRNDQLTKRLMEVLNDPINTDLVPREDQQTNEQYKTMDFKQDEFLKIHIDQVFQILKVLDSQNLLEPRLLFLIQNLLERRSENWKESMGAKGNTAMKLNDVKNQYANEPQEKSRQRQDNKQKLTQQNQQTARKEQQLYQQKSDSLEITTEDLQSFEKKNKKQIEETFQEAISAGAEQGVDVLLKYINQQNFVNYEIIPYLCFNACKIKNDVDKNIEFMKAFLQKYFSVSNNKQNLKTVLEALILCGYLNLSDYNIITEAFASILCYMRSDLKLFNVDDIIIRSQGDEDEDEEVLDYTKRQLIEFAKKTQKQEPDLSNFKKELNILTARINKELLFKVENLSGEITDSLK